MPVEEMIVLACSKKWGGRCVAGISRRTGEWVRPVSNHAHRELYPYHYRIDGRGVDLLDVVGFEHEGPVGDVSQPENVEVGGSRWWRIGKIDPGSAAGILAPYLTHGSVLLGNRGAAVPEEEAMRGVDASLALVRPRDLQFHLEPPYEGASRMRPRVSFELGEQGYDLALTDHLLAPRLVKAGPGAHDFDDLGFDGDADTYLTVSLAEARDEWCTKLVAAAIFLPGGA